MIHPSHDQDNEECFCGILESLDGPAQDTADEEAYPIVDSVGSEIYELMQEADPEQARYDAWWKEIEELGGEG